ncbi:hypothetical protein GYMLUDRAFT_47660 [Collybiopsis luxurians FD-317 M1]|uniref:RanBD1 domain-containing protein n=1 Tax=Collybiopsis luxurians FD-317 M1 TaxID=944289 RepID=A0A0D0CKN6_9AGAR|nr:hypothetical protein GYMLUDRAFT_47660 [Collybiopsis luxurians FD-317 M1]
MSDDEIQRHPDDSATNSAVDTPDNVEDDGAPNPVTDGSTNTRDMTSRRSPVLPPSPPSPSFNDSETKLSRKREREVSLEPLPGSTSKSNTITDLSPSEKDYARTPAKKNRIHRSAELDATAEEEDSRHASGHHRSASNSSDGDSPPTTQADLGIASSPPQEMKIKVRQISQGVEDLTWRNLKKQKKDDDHVASRAIGTALDEQENIASKDGDDLDNNDDQAIMPDDGSVSAPPTTTQIASAASSARTSGSSSRRDSDSNLEGAASTLNLKRKYPDRGTSAEPTDSHLDATALASGSETSVKRPRDDSDKDDNPRETKRPTPPPLEKKDKPPPLPANTKPTSTSGFMAYASSSSPFASVKGQNVFASAPPPNSSAVKTPLPSSPVLGGTTELAPSSSSTSSAGTKRSSFEAFASSSSPLASIAQTKSPVLGSGTFGATSALGRAKSPSRRGPHSHASTSVFGSSSGSTGPASSSSGGGVSAFTAYASGGVQGFSLPVTKRARGEGDSGAGENSTLAFGAAGGGGEDSDGGGNESGGTFGEKLRAAEDDTNGDDDWDESKPKVALSEQEVSTGEEDEETIHQVRGKLFALVDGAWKERGTGLLKLNVRVADGGGARLVMRKEAVYTLLLNVTLFSGMKCSLAQDPRYLRFSVIEGSQVTTHYNLRLANAKIATELMQTIHENLPSK